MVFSLTTYLQNSNYTMEDQYLRKFSEFCLKGILDQIQKPLSELQGPQ